MLDALRTRGFHGVGISELRVEAQAPDGVPCHRLPGGKTELAAWMTDAHKTRLDSDYGRGCPLATIALESTADETAVRDAVAQGFAAMRDTLNRAPTTGGVPSERAASLATLIVSACEGTLIQARAAGSKKPPARGAGRMHVPCRREGRGLERRAEV